MDAVSAAFRLGAVPRDVLEVVVLIADATASQLSIELVLGVVLTVFAIVDGAIAIASVSNTAYYVLELDNVMSETTLANGAEAEAGLILSTCADLDHLVGRIVGNLADEVNHVVITALAADGKLMRQIILT